MLKKVCLSLGAVLALAACGGGGSNPGPNPLPSPTQAPVTHYSVGLHWQPASQVGLAAALRRPESSVRVMDSSTMSGTIIVQVPTGGQSMFDSNGSAAYITVSVSPEPSPASDVSFSTTSSAVTIQATPQPSYPDPSASPAVLAEGKANAIDQSGTLSATVAGATTTKPIWAIGSLTLVAPHSGSPTAPDAVGFTFDSTCTAVPQGMTTGSDIYITGPDNATLNFPYGGVTLAHGVDVSTLTADQWTNSITSITFSDYSTSMYDTILFKTSSGRIVYLSGNEYGGSNPYSSGAFFQGGYGCLS